MAVLQSEEFQPQYAVMKHGAGESFQRIRANKLVGIEHLSEHLSETEVDFIYYPVVMREQFGANLGYPCSPFPKLELRRDSQPSNRAIHG